MISLEIIFGYAIAMVVGGVLGVLGAGGAILAVPALIYLFHVPVREATHLSLGIVALVALFGIRSSWKAGEVESGWVFKFFLPSSVGVFLARRLLVPSIPAEWEFLLVVAFAALMLLAARAMLIPKKSDETAAAVGQWGFVVRCLGVGTITGMLGAGGGFLIVPILTLWGRLPFRKAAATSLAIIFLNSILGFISGWNDSARAYLPLLGVFVLFAAVGLVLARRFAGGVSADHLKRGFGWFLVGVGVLTLLQEGIQKF